MKIKTKRILMLLLLSTGIMWNVLWVFNIISLNLSIVSAVAIVGYSFILNFMPLFFPGIIQAREKSTYIYNLTKREKQMSYATVGLALVWIVTLIACIVSSS